MKTIALCLKTWLACYVVQAANVTFRRPVTTSGVESTTINKTYLVDWRFRLVNVSANNF
jgi:hypothetical protein